MTIFFFIGCKKDNQDNQDNNIKIDSSKIDFYSGNYSFITTSTSYPDSAVPYDGSINFDTTLKVLTINYYEEIYNPAFPYTISPIVDDKGVLSYPDWTAPYTGYFFNGNIDYKGNINFKMGLRIFHHGDTLVSSRAVTGKKK